MKILLLITASFFALAAYSQKGTVFIGTQTYPLPAKADTLRVIIEYSDTTSYRGSFYYSGVYQKRALMVVGGDVWTPYYLETTKKRMSTKYIVWNAIIY